MNKLEITGDWNIAKGKIKQKWAKLTDDDLQSVAGKEEELIGRIQKRTGEAREQVERALHDSCRSAEQKRDVEKSLAGTARVTESAHRRKPEITAMKQNQNQDNTPNDGAHLQPVLFEFTHPTAREVCIAGTFNDWQPEAKPMHSMGRGRWLKETILPPGSYEYCLVVDGKYVPDPLARETVSNPFGGKNSVLKVACPPEAAQLAAAENLPTLNTKKQKTARI